jgi:hypothetical protein
MKTEQQRIAIAEACGWGNIPWEKTSALGHLIALKPDKSTGFMPDYLNDLNAMHEAEKVLTYDQFDDYYIELAKRMVRPFHATASQRAEAFLRTIGKWVES